MSQQKSKSLYELWPRPQDVTETVSLVVCISNMKLSLSKTSKVIVKLTITRRETDGQNT